MSSNTDQATKRRWGILLGLGGAGIVCVGLLGLAVVAALIGLDVIGDGGAAPVTLTPQPTATPPPTTTPPTPTNTPTPTARPATSTPAVPIPSPVAPTSTSAPAVAPTSTTAALPPTAPPPAAPPSSGVVSTFLADARQTQDGLSKVKVWFDRMAGGENVQCSTIRAHSIHRPSSTAPAQVPDLSPTWNEYQAAIADGQLCLQWLIDFCNAGGGTIDNSTFWDRRTLSADALSHCEHVVQDLESR